MPTKPPRDRTGSNERKQPKDVEEPESFDANPASASTHTGGPSKEWTFTGRLRVLEAVTTGVTTLRDLVKVEMEVCASDISADGPWTQWGLATTDATGGWTLKHVNAGATRFFRVRCRLRAEDLEVNDSDLNDIASFDLLDLNWRTIWKSEVQLAGPTVDVGTRVFATGNPYELGNETWRRQAIVWYAVRTAMDRLVQEDPWFAFKSKIAVIYPAHVISGASTSNGITRMAYLQESEDFSDWHPSVALHEVMHLWNYDHNVGTTNWLAALCSLRGPNPVDLDTHGFQENPNVAFHEGFAEWASQALMNELWGTRKVRPFNRHHLYTELALTTLDMVEKNDDGVTHGLHLLQSKGTEGWWKHLFGTATTPPGSFPIWVDASGNEQAHYGEVGEADLTGLAVPDGKNGLSLWELLRTFRAHPAKGWDTDWQVGNSTYGLLRFIDRAVDIHGLGEDMRLRLKRWLDPLATDEPRDSLQTRQAAALDAFNAGNLGNLSATDIASKPRPVR